MPTLTPDGCAHRRRRFAELLAQSGHDVALITDVADCYYFTGVLVPNDLPVALLVFADATSWLAFPDGSDMAETVEAEPYSWNHRGTRHPDPLARLANVFAGAESPKLRDKRIAVQNASLSAMLSRQLAEAGVHGCVGIDEMIATMQRCKDSDELAIMRESIRANLAAYDAVAEMIAPGVNELDVLSAGRRGATRAAGEKVFHDGDYQSGSYNGPARNRRIEQGELYIVDAWTCYRGYWSDMCRTFVVGADADDTQRRLFDHVRWVQAQVPNLLRPGADGTDVYRALDEMIRLHPPLAEDGLIHHGGHAIGLRSHEMPDINLARGGRLEPGNVICIEPGGYFAAARYGVRLENMYLITDTGCEDLCPGNISLLTCG